MGSIKAEKREAVAKQITATEIFATFIAPKKKNQCNATIAPIPRRGSMSFLFIVLRCIVSFI